MRLLALINCLLGSVLAGCHYTGPYVTETTEVQVVWTAEPSTTIYQRAGELGEYRLARYQGLATRTVVGGRAFGLTEAAQEQSSRAVAQPLGTDRVTLTRTGLGAQLAFKGGSRCQLLFVTGSWSEFAAGQEVVLKFAEASWQQWTAATHQAFLAQLDELRAQVESVLVLDDQLSEPTIEPLLVDEKPLIRAGRQRLLVFFEALELAGGFDIVSRRPEPEEEWWIANYDLRPGAGQFVAVVAQTAGRVAVGAAHWMSVCARAVGRGVCH